MSFSTHLPQTVASNTMTDIDIDTSTKKASQINHFCEERSALPKKKRKKKDKR